MNEENQNLNSMLNHMISNHDDLEKQIRSLVQEKQQLTGVDTIQIVNPHHKSEDKFNLRILSPRSAEIESNGAVSHQSYHSSDCHDRVREMEGKTHKFMDDMQLPSKKRKTNYVQLDQSQNGMIINSSINDSPAVVSHQSYQSSDCHGRVWEMEGKKPKFMDDMLLPSKKRKINYVQLDQIHNVMIDSSMDDTLICDEPPKKKHSRLNKGSSQQMEAAPKKIVSVRTRTNVSMISDGCQWRKYGQKMTRNNTQPRSYYRCAMAPSCPVKRQV